MHIRKNKSLNISFTDEPGWLDDKMDHADNEPETTDTFELDHVRVCIRKLPEGYHAVLNLYVFDEMKH